MRQKKLKRTKYRKESNNNRQIIEEMGPVIKELKKRNIKHNQDYTVGLGDKIEEVLTMFGITEERFKAWTGLKQCNCEGRKKWLNGIFYWHRKSND